MKRFLLAICAVLCLGLFVSSAQAAEDWTINSFDSDIRIQSDGRLAVTETIAVTFDSLKHGIFRDIPYMYRTADGGEKKLDIEEVSVTRNGTTEPFTQYASGNNWEIKVGDADKTITDDHTYELHYLVTGALLGYEGYDELYWNVTGGDWLVGMKKVTATVHLPENGVIQASCYLGYAGSTQVCGSQSERLDQVQFGAGRPLLAGEQLTVAVAYTAGMVPLLEGTGKQAIPLNWVNWPLAVGLGIIFFLAGLVLAIRFLWRNGRDRDEAGNPVGFGRMVYAPQFESPAGLHPAELGVLVDERADTLDITSTIVWLATQGYLTITEKEKTWAFGSSDYVLTKIKKDPHGLREYEVQLLKKLFLLGDSISLSEMKNTFYKDLVVIKDSLYEEVVKLGLFAEHPNKVRVKYGVIAVGIIVLGGGVVLIANIFFSSVLLALGVALVPVGFVFLVGAVSMARRTAKGRQLYREALGYKLFLSQTEKYRQPFFEKENTFMDILPYAIVFGVTAKLAKAFNDMGIVPPTPTWYVGTNPFHAMAFASSMDSFSRSVGSAMASAPSSSGSGGGGFSGGGFGGGGGGSW